MLTSICYKTLLSYDVRITDTFVFFLMSRLVSIKIIKQSELLGNIYSGNGHQSQPYFINIILNKKNVQLRFLSQLSSFLREPNNLFCS